MVVRSFGLIPCGGGPDDVGLFPGVVTMSVCEKGDAWKLFECFGGSFSWIINSDILSMHYGTNS